MQQVRRAGWNELAGAPHPRARRLYLPFCSSQQLLLNHLYFPHSKVYRISAFRVMSAGAEQAPVWKRNHRGLTAQGPEQERRQILRALLT